MIKINQLKLPSTYIEKDFKQYIAKYLQIDTSHIQSYRILKRSIDARKKPEIFYVFSVAVSVGSLEKSILKKQYKNGRITLYQKQCYQLPDAGDVALNQRPVIIGAGPAGLFCAYLLAQAGFCPIIIERGAPVERRTADVATFWQSGVLKPDSNVQFGEGGAGTFSDGKLNTLVRDKTGKNQYVLETFVSFGASENILWDAKPHIGTDVLVRVIRNMRLEIERLGGTFRFNTKVCDFTIENNAIHALQTSKQTWDTKICVLAIGHSARDTFRTLYHKNINMSAKEFAVGFRIEHPQEMINLSQYGSANIGNLPVASYKLATKLKNGRGVYSFCMCPGGHVVNASSVSNQLVVNGMSYAKRDSANANSAIVVTVGAKEYRLGEPMSAIAFQESLEQKAFLLGDGKIPQQLFGDFVCRTKTVSYGDFASVNKGDVVFSDLNPLFSEDMRDSFLKGMELFGHRIHGFDRKDAILSGIESRTSSPIRIHRDEAFESNIKGLYPCGEGAGFAGGIMSAAMDGMKVAEEIIKRYRVSYES